MRHHRFDKREASLLLIGRHTQKEVQRMCGLLNPALWGNLVELDWKTGNGFSQDPYAGKNRADLHRC
jgi:hypothetical protein